MEKIVEKYKKIAEKEDFTFSFSKINEDVYEVTFEKNEDLTFKSELYIYPNFVYFSLISFKQKRIVHPQISYSPLLPKFVSFQEDVAKEKKVSFLAFDTSTSFRFSGNQKMIKDKFSYMTARDTLSNKHREFFQMKHFPHTLLIKELKEGAFYAYLYQNKVFIDIFHLFQENDPTFTYTLDYFFVKPHFYLKRIFYYLDGENGTISFKQRKHEIFLTIKEKTHSFSSSEDAASFLDDYLKRRQKGLRIKNQISPPRNYFDEFMGTLEEFSYQDSIQNQIHDELLTLTHRDYKKIERAAKEYLNNNINSKCYYLNNDRIEYFSFLEKTFILTCIDGREIPFDFTSCPVENTKEEVEKAVIKLSKHQLDYFLTSNKYSNKNLI